MFQQISFKCNQNLSNAESYLFFLIQYNAFAKLLYPEITKGSFCVNFTWNQVNFGKLCITWSGFPGWKWKYFDNKATVSRGKKIFQFFLDSSKDFAWIWPKPEKTILFFPERSFCDESSINYLLGQTLVSRVETYLKKKKIWIFRKIFERYEKIWLKTTLSSCLRAFIHFVATILIIEIIIETLRVTSTLLSNTNLRYKCSFFSKCLLRIAVAIGL